VAPVVREDPRVSPLVRALIVRAVPDEMGKNGVAIVRNALIVRSDLTVPAMIARVRVEVNGASARPAQLRTNRSIPLSTRTSSRSSSIGWPGENSPG
jgi:hypothetical protein